MESVIARKDSRLTQGRWIKALALFAMTLVLVLVGVALTSPEAHAAAKVSKARCAKGVSTWDCVYFGQYPQSDAKGKKKDPIKWRVLDVKGNKALVISDSVLDGQPYNGSKWSNSGVRKWLNSTFYNAAFTPSQKKDVYTTSVDNAKDAVFNGVDKDSTTKDKVFLLSYSEIKDGTYGLVECGDRIASPTWEANLTKYAAKKLQGADNKTWRLRTPSYWGPVVVAMGTTSWEWSASGNFGVRPACWINLDSPHVKKAGKVSTKYMYVDYSPKTITYTGTPMEIKATNVYYGGKKLVEGKDYTMSKGNGFNYEGAVMGAGEVDYSFIGKGNYKDKHYQLNLSIVPKNTTSFSVGAGAKSFTASWTAQSEKMGSDRITGYQIRYSTKKSMAGAKTVTVKGHAKTSRVVGKLNAKTTYYVQIRTYTRDNGVDYCSTWSKAKKVKTA